MHWSLVIVKNLHLLKHRLLSFVNLLRDGAPSLVEQDKNVFSDRHRATNEPRKPIVTEDEEVPCLLHLDSAHLHIATPLFGIIRRLLTALYIEDTVPCPALDSSTTVLNGDLAIDDKNLPGCVNAMVVPGISIKLEQQVRQLLDVTEKILHDKSLV